MVIGAVRPTLASFGVPLKVPVPPSKLAQTGIPTMEKLTGPLAAVTVGVYE